MPVAPAFSLHYAQIIRKGTASKAHQILLGGASLLPLSRKYILCNGFLILFCHLQELTAVFKLLFLPFDNAKHLAEHGRLRPVLEKLYFQ